MQQRSKILLAAAGVLAALLVVFTIAMRPAASDADQIAAQTETLRAAAEKHSSSGVMSVVSADYHDGALSNTDQLNFFLKRVMGKADPIQVQFTNAATTITGDTAATLGHLRVTAAADGHIVTEQDITLRWRREQGRRWLVFPTPVWRLTGAEYTGVDLGE